MVVLPSGLSRYVVLTTSLLSLVPDAPEEPPDDEVSLDAEALSSVEEVVSVELVDETASVPELLSSVVAGGGGGGGAMVAVVSPEIVDAAALSVEDADVDVSEEGGGGGGILDPSLSPICSWSDRSADCTSSPSEEKELFDETVPVVEVPS